ncbi:hypothetical protein [Burkholderia ubonensis]|uniref:hypothetical protein n=1 Tax=Burkholderia ubonensis TaxID=101571 RepID=UPI0012F741D0|nr:hypothetical protein [Burkholderia ubonensis]
MRQAIGAKFKARCKIDPYDLGHIFLQDPRNGSWITVPAKNQEYASGLTLTQHRLIRAAAKERLTSVNADAVLRRSRLALQNEWAHAIHSGRRLKGSRNVARAQEPNSIDILDPRAHSMKQEQPDLLVVDDELKYPTQSIPTFETFQLEKI